MSTFTIYADAVADATKRIATANRRLERAGIPDRFAMTLGETYLSEENEEGHRHLVRDLTLEQPIIAAAGWQFVAALDQVGDEFVVRTHPDHNLDGWRPTSQVCDHCGASRHRKNTYLVRHIETGEIKQVGSTCVQAFTGISLQGLWTLGTDIFDGATSGEGSIWGAGGERAVEVEWAIAASLAVSDCGRNYVSRARSTHQTPATGEGVSDVVFGLFGKPTPAQVVWREEMLEAARGYLTDGTVAQVIEHVAGLEEASDYIENLQVLLRAGHVTGRHVALIASAVVPWARHTQRVAERAANPIAAGFIAPVGEKVTGLDVVVTLTRVISGYYADKDLILMRTADGHVLKWMASTVREDIGTGARLRLTRASVKAHETYQGTDQTVLTRVAYEVLTDAALAS